MTIDGEPWFAAVDACHFLGMEIPRGVGPRLRFLANGERRVVTLTSSNGPRATNIISESGLYKLIMRSDKPEAHAFQDWVTQSVLPAIRKDGGYIMGEEKVRTGRARHKDRPARDARTSWGG